MGMWCGSSTITAGALAILLMLAFISVDAARITVGNSNHWRFGYNYTDWALKTAPFYQNDTLVFMYEPPNSTTFPHSVYLLKNSSGFAACDLRKATVAGSVVQGGGQGLEFVLKKRKTYYFVCGEGAGLHCTAGLMKFSVRPVRPRHG